MAMDLCNQDMVKQVLVMFLTLVQSVLLQLHTASLTVLDTRLRNKGCEPFSGNLSWLKNSKCRGHRDGTFVYFQVAPGYLIWGSRPNGVYNLFVSKNMPRSRNSQHRLQQAVRLQRGGCTTFGRLDVWQHGRGPQMAKQTCGSLAGAAPRAY